MLNLCGRESYAKANRLLWGLARGSPTGAADRRCMDGRAIKAEKNGQRGRDSALTPPKALSLPSAVALVGSKAGHLGPLRG